LKNGWFEVDRKGLRALVAGKPKSLILRELTQNAWDEPRVTRVSIATAYKKGVATIRVEDDAPEGFVDLAHAYTLFADTRKRSNPNQRGRFNLGEKEVLSLCDTARIMTTKGGVEFLSNGSRKHLRKKRESGSEVSIVIRMSRKEYDEMLAAVSVFIPPCDIATFMNGVQLPERKPETIIKTKLPTEIAEDTPDGKVLRRRTRKTAIQVYRINGEEKAFLYEMGLPVCETGDAYHYNIMQKVPLGTDRETVPASYLRVIRAEVANTMVEHVAEEDSSANWLRDAMSSKRIDAQAVKEIVEKRFGDKVAVATPGNSRSNEAAIDHGYRLIRPSELSREEWENVRETEAALSSAKLFPVETVPGELVPREAWTHQQIRTTDFVKFLGRQVFGVNVRVEIYESEEATITADYSAGRHRLRFNALRISSDMWKSPAQGDMLELIIHELGHEGGGHYEHGYHDALCRIAVALPQLVHNFPEWHWIN
jgi:hypothetical protein